MSQRVRCNTCRTAFVTDENQAGGVVECPKCGARHRLPATTRQDTDPAPPSAPAPLEAADEVTSVFVPSNEKRARRSVRRWLVVVTSLAIVAAAGVAVLVYWPRVKPRPADAVERVAEDYLQALTRNDLKPQHRLSTVEEPPAIRSFQRVARDRTRNRTIKGSFAPLASLHRHIESEFSYDPAIARFTPKHPLGAAAETLDAVHAAKDEAEKTKLYEKMASGDPNDIFDAAENFGRVFSKLAEGALAPKKIIPTYRMLVDDAKPPIPSDQKALAAHVSEHSKAWDTLLKRPFHTLKGDGPFIFDEAEVDAQVTDLLGSLGDPPTSLRLSLVRFRLEGIDTAWRVIAARRLLPGRADEATAGESPNSPTTTSPGEQPLPRSLGDPAIR
jgi:hypothetical protein